VHGCDREAAGDPPGLTALTGQYLRPSELWVCYRRDVPQLSHLADTDQSDEFNYCVRADKVELAVKLAYYAARAIKLLKTSPIPPPA